MARGKIIEKSLSLGLTADMYAFLERESDMRGCALVEVIRMAIFELSEKRRELDICRLEAEVRYLEMLREEKERSDREISG